MVEDPQVAAIVDRNVDCSDWLEDTCVSPRPTDRRLFVSTQNGPLGGRNDSVEAGCAFAPGNGDERAILIYSVPGTS